MNLLPLTKERKEKAYLAQGTKAEIAEQIQPAPGVPDEH